MAEIFEKVM